MRSMCVGPKLSSSGLTCVVDERGNRKRRFGCAAFDYDWYHDQWFTGFAMILTVLYRSGDIDAALAENPAYPFMAIFKNAVGSSTAAAAMASVMFCLATSSTVGLLASSSRVFWAFSRDRGLPGWRTLSKVGHESPLIRGSS